MHTQQRRRSSRAAGWLFLSTLLSTLGVSANVAAAQEARAVRVETTEDRRIDTSGAKPVARPVARPAAQRAARSASRQHTSQRPAAEPAPRRSLVSRAAHNEVIAEPLPEVFHDGMRIAPAYGSDPGCGLDPGCGMDAGCGMEPGCGIGMDYDPVCGIEPRYGIEPGCGIEGCDGCCGPAGCDSPGRGGFGAECIPLMLPVARINWSQFEFFAGTQAFSGPPNFDGPGGVASAREGTASFGLNEGFNHARPMTIFGVGFASQFGLRAVQTNASGAEFTSDHRRQIFLTGGLFRRVDYGLQGGVVFDYLYDDWHYEANLAQLRGELSWMFDCNEFGYGFMAGIEDDRVSATVRNGNGVESTHMIALESTDQHRIFYRRHFRNHGYGEMFTGWTEDDDGLLGIALQIPVMSDLALRTGFTYMNPDLMPGQHDHQEETWNIGLSVVWYPCAGRRGSRYARPMFEVADNGTFIVDRR